MSHEAVITIVLGLVAYLRAHPSACDTSEGIARWWAAPPEAIGSQDELDAALRFLQSHGAVETVIAADGRIRWRCGSDAAVVAAAVAAGRELSDRTRSQ